jgi:hypothetical protein
MNESLRTLIYVGVAGVVSLLAWINRPSTVTEAGDVTKLTNQPLFPEFKDPLAASSLEIIQFDENTAALRNFKVNKQRGLWVIPSHGDYPADAEQQIREAAGSLTNLTSIAVASSSAKDHELFGVVEPDKAKLKPGDKNVGTLVALQDDKGNDLVRLIVGKEVDKAPGQRFVRRPGQEVVFISEIALDKLPTEFDKWIEKDLLKINTFDVSHLNLKDYSIVPDETGRPAISLRMEAAVAWNNELSSWNLDRMRIFSKPSRQFIDTPLAETEELNRQKLDDLKSALDDLKIVDVQRKPKILGETLRSGQDLLTNRELIEALAEFGFVPGMLPEMDKPDIFATNGEVAVDMKDGVRYVLRFGRVQGAEQTSGDAKTGDDDEVKLNRYLFVTAQLSPLTLVEPEYEPEPAGPATVPATPGSEGEQPAPTDKSAGEQPPDAAAQPADPADPAKPPAVADPQAAERNRIKRENEKKRNDYNDKKKKAQARVAELNGRFADWYYVISEDVYKKIHLTRNDIVKEGATARDEGFGVDAFRKLEQGGLNPPPPPPPSSSPAFPGPPGGFPM